MRISVSQPYRILMPFETERAGQNSSGALSRNLKLSFGIFAQRLAEKPSTIDIHGSSGDKPVANDKH